MQTFKDLYPYIILTIGISDAIVLLFVAVVGSVTLALKQDPDFLGRMFPSLLILGFGTFAAIMVLAFTKWMLT